MKKAHRFQQATALLMLACLIPLVARAEDSRRHLTDASWSPRGDRAALLFSLCDDSQVADGSELWIADPQGLLRAVRLPGPGARLLGWTPDGEGVVLDEGPGTVTVITGDGSRSTRIRLPEAAVCLGSDGQTAWFLSEDRRYLLSQDTLGQTRVVAPMPAGVRGPGALSPDGRHLALRRSVRRPGTGRAQWNTEVWVVESGTVVRVATVEDPLVRVSWHPSRPALLLNSPTRSGEWDASLVERDGRRWTLAARHLGLPSPLQWDRSGRLYTADASGLVQVQRTMRRLRDWSPAGSRLTLWAVSPDGQHVLAGLEQAHDEETQVLLFPLPGGEAIPVPARRAGGNPTLR